MLRVKHHCCRKLSTYTLFLITLYLSAIALVAFVCKDIPLSPLFKEFHRDTNKLSQQVSDSNTLRLEEATQYFKSRRPADSIKHYKREFKGQVDIVIAIVTVKRKSRQTFSTGYLIQTSAALDKIVRTHNTSFNVTLFICNTETKDSDHSEANFVSAYIPMVTKHSDQSERNANVTVLQKETKDYIYCLSTARMLTPRYILMVEDDSVPNENFLEVIQQSLTQIGERKFAFLKLFYPPKWQGFALEISRVLELLCFGAIGGSFFLVFHHTCQLHRHWKRSLYVQYIVGFLFTVTVIYLIGRQNIMTFRSRSRHFHSLHPSPACCTPAMLYPLETVPTLVDFLNNSQQLDSDVGLDLQINEFTQTFDLPGYQIEPNLFRHIGMISSLSKPIKHPEEFL